MCWRPSILEWLCHSPSAPCCDAPGCLRRPCAACIQDSYPIGRPLFLGSGRLVCMLYIYPTQPITLSLFPPRARVCAWQCYTKTSNGVRVALLTTRFVFLGVPDSRWFLPGSKRGCCDWIHCFSYRSCCGICGVSGSLSRVPLSPYYVRALPQVSL